MLTFNKLLEIAGLDPEHVRLLRHRDSDPEKHQKMATSALAGDQFFQDYQEHQVTDSVIAAFRKAKHLAAFVVEPGSKQTVFVGVWDCNGERKPRPKFGPFGGLLQPGHVVFNTTRHHAFDDYRGRLVIDWGDGTRAWVQRADQQDKPIIELRSTAAQPPFPGFMDFRRSLDEIAGIPTTWAEALSDVRGVYLLVHRDTGAQYVGSAYGEKGFYGRWCSYADGHGGNVAMKELGEPADAYDVTILEVARSSETDKEVIARESMWKDKLGRSALSLHRN